MVPLLPERELSLAPIQIHILLRRIANQFTIQPPFPKEEKERPLQKALNVFQIVPTDKMRIRIVTGLPAGMSGQTLDLAVHHPLISVRKLKTGS
ncbi:hypothetical protein AD950_04340 [Gluconobacter oxydans]|nr:hypothetical protein AD950_04340 [Gluconobacter oxydans]